MKQKAVAAVIGAGVLWGCINIFIQNLTKAGLDSMEIAGVRNMMACAIFAVVLLLKDRSLFKIKLKDIWIFACSGLISITLFSVLYFSTIVHGQASVAVVLLYTSPVFVMLLSAALFKEKITGVKIAALIMTLLGCVFVSGVLTGSLTVSVSVFITGILSGFFYGLYTIFGRAALEKYDSLTVTFWTFAFASVGSLFVGKLPATFEILSHEPSAVFWLLGCAVCCSVLPYFLYTWGLQRMESSKAAILVAIEPLVGAVLGMTAFREPVSFTKLLGIGLILAAIIVMNLPAGKRQKK